MNNLFNKIKFETILSNDTVYGIVWSATIGNDRCVVKMLVLTSGSVDTKHFRKNDNIPWYHKEFRDKKPLTRDQFIHEGEACSKLDKLGIAPKLYGYWIYDKLDIHYGFIVLERLDCSVKQILLQRELRSHENKLIESLIHKLHRECGIVHGDMKPSNIGVYLDNKKEIRKCYFFDCQKVKYRSKMSRNEFKIREARDNIVYKDHSINNREKGLRYAMKQKTFSVYRH